MRPAAPKRQRCAIYTRKSTEHNLDLAFNSLDAQREACEAYIKSQAHEGWALVPARFDDGGLSGASLDRPALQTLLEEVRAKKIAIVVVYKVDRLTRSLADFAKLVEIFDAHDVSFVSVTQSFNTTSSMGRLTLNVLLSFAQFEREVIGERVRDKIAASKRKGIWVGGPVPLGYRSVDKKLEIVADEAELVRKIFADYLRLGSIGALAASLDQEGIRPKPRRLANGTVIAAERFMVGPLAHLLKNRFYIGEVVYRDEAHAGAQPPILDRETFEAVQLRLRAGAITRSAARATSKSILIGRLFDDRGNPMTPTHANKQGIRYRYYVSNAVLQGRKAEAGSVARVSAPDLESRIIAAVRDRFPCSSGDGLPDQQLVETHVVRITIAKDRIVLSLRQHAMSDDDHWDQAAIEEVALPFAAPRVFRRGIVHSPSNDRAINPEARDTLLTTIARSRAWMEAILSGEVSSFDEIAALEKLAERYVRRLAVLAYLSPKIVQGIVDGTAPADLTISMLTQSLPCGWAKQEQLFRLS